MSSTDGKIKLGAITVDSKQEHIYEARHNQVTHKSQFTIIKMEILQDNIITTFENMDRQVPQLPNDETTVDGVRENFDFYARISTYCQGLTIPSSTLYLPTKRSEPTTIQFDCKKLPNTLLKLILHNTTIVKLQQDFDTQFKAQIEFVTANLYNQIKINLVLKGKCKYGHLKTH